MNRTGILKSRLLIVVVFAVLLGAIVGAQGTTVNLSIAASDVTQQPRPHPKSHLQIAAAATLIAPSSIIPYPRPHPQSHIQISEPDSVTRIPRPHPQSHLRSTVIETLLNQP